MALALLKLSSPVEKDIDSLRLLTIWETADMLQISPRTVLRMARNKQLPAFKLGGQWRVRQSELAKWLEALKRQ